MVMSRTLSGHAQCIASLALSLKAATDVAPADELANELWHANLDGMLAEIGEHAEAMRRQLPAVPPVEVAAGAQN